MSIQDESFPHDEFFNVLDFSPKVGHRIQFPHRLYKNHQHQPQHLHQHKHEHNPPASISSTNTSPSSTEHNISNESANGRPSSELSAKTTTSDPTGLLTDHENHEKKAVSYQDIHSEYTKRRYKHVESKVGQYIANLKAEDQKRRNSAKFQRHRSMPDKLCAPNSVEAAREARYSAAQYSTTELHKINDSTSEAEADSSENTTGTTSGSSSRGVQHESSDDASGATDFIDKLAYAQLVTDKERIQSYSDYLQTRLDEQIGENMRLKRNVDYMRIELNNCKDKLKSQASALVPNIGASQWSSTGFICGVRQPQQYLCQPKCTKATQTELIIPPPLQAPPACDVYITPDTDTTDANKRIFDSNSEVSSNCEVNVNSGPTIQPISLNFSNIVEQDNGDGNGNGNKNGGLRQRTTSNSSTKATKTPGTNNLKTVPMHHNSRNNYPSGSDSAVDIESAELGVQSTQTCLRKILSPSRNRQRQDCREEFIYYDQRSGRYAAIMTLDASSDNVYDDDNVATVSTTANGGRKEQSKKQNSLRRRWLRLFRRCTRCNDNNQTLDTSTYTQIPLLDKSTENNCCNQR